MEKNLEWNTFIENIPGGVHRCRLFGDICMDYASEGLCEMIGRSAQEIAEDFHNDYALLLHEDDRERFNKTIKNLADNPGSATLEYRICRKDGSILWVSDTIKSVRLEDGRMWGFAVVTDIDSAKRAQLKMQILMDTFPGAVVQYKYIGKERLQIDYMNESTADLLGYSLEEYSLFENQDPLNFLHEEDIPMVSDTLVRLIDEDVPGECICRLQAKFDYIWVKVRFKTVIRERNQIYITAVFFNVTEEMKQELALKEALIREETFRSALTEGAVLAFVVDGDTWKRIPSTGDIVPEAYQEELNAIKFLEQAIKDLVHPEDRHIAHTLLEAGKQKEEEEFYLEFRSRAFNYSYDGYRWFGIHRRRLINTEPGCVHYLIYANSIHEKKMEENALREKANKDPLTGVINRASFESLSQRAMDLAIKDNGTVGFIAIDLDNFKGINDRFGHVIGDKVLITAAKELQALFRQNGLVARIGGDELAVLLPNFSSQEFLHKKAAAICGAIQTMYIDGKSLPVSCSIGVSVCPQHGTDFSNLYHHADLALYQAKQSGKNQYCFYGQEVTLPDMGVWIDKEWLMDTIGSLIYISDVKTYELIYMSKALCQKFGVTNYKSKKCYEVLQGCSTPCDFCPNAKLTFDEFYCWEYQNPQFGIKAILKDKLINWNGRTARMEVITEIST